MKIITNLKSLEVREKPNTFTKYEEIEDELGKQLVKREKPKKLYDYYICDYCNKEIKIEKKWEEKTGGIMKIPQSLSKLDTVIYLVLHNKCLKNVIEEFKSQEV